MALEPITLDILDTWCRQHNLSINIGKTKSVLFGTKKFNTNITCSNLTIAGEEIMFVDEYKNLGIILDKHLSFTKHIRYVQGLAAHKIYMLSKIRPCITQSVAIRIYKTKILPYFDQGDILFIDAFKKDTDKLQKLQNRALRICLNTNNRHHIVNLHNTTKISYLNDRRIYHLKIYAFSKTRQPEYLDNVQIRTRHREAPRSNCKQLTGVSIYKLH